MTKIKRYAPAVTICLSLLFLLFSCSGDDTSIPRPKGYFRITFPKQTYQAYKGKCPIQFEYPNYGKIVYMKSPAHECWFNIEYPRFDAALHFSYIDTKYLSLKKCLHDAHELAYKHTVKATDIEEIPVRDTSRKVFGLIYDIKGNAASNYQFYLTDSTDNFLRASLYFRHVPNADSLKPVIKFVKKDISHLIKTLHWEKNAAM